MDNLTEALADVRSALESAATTAVESAAENFDFDPAIEEACGNYDFEKAIEYAVENYDFEDAVTNEARNFDFSDLAADAVKEAIDDFDIAFSVHEHIETELGSEHFAVAVEENDTVQGLGISLELLEERIKLCEYELADKSRRITELEDARLSYRLRKACREAKRCVSSFFTYPHPVI